MPTLYVFYDFHVFPPVVRSICTPRYAAASCVTNVLGMHFIPAERKNIREAPNKWMHVAGSAGQRTVPACAAALLAG